MFYAGSPFYGRSCVDCKSWVYDSSGKVQTLRGSDRPMPRLPSMATECRGCPKMEHLPMELRTYERRAEIADEAYDALNLYLECWSVQSFPDDYWVRKVALIVRTIQDSSQQARNAEMLAEQLIPLLTLAATRD